MDALFGWVEIGLNRYLSLEPAALEACANLAGRVVALCLEDWGRTVYFTPEEGGISVADTAPAEVDVTLSGSTMAFMRLLATGGDWRAELVAGDVQVQGDTDLAERFAGILDSVHLDPEELLAPIMGDLMAYRLSRVGRGLFGWGRHVTSTLSRDTAEFLREETGDLVHSEDISDWMEAVDRLAGNAEALQARLQRLKAAGTVSS